MAKAANQRPSQILEIRTLVERSHRVDGWYTCYLFDQAVIMFGNRIESMLHVYEDGKPKYELKQLLGQEKSSATAGVTRIHRDDPRISHVKPRVRVRKNGNGQH